MLGWQRCLDVLVDKIYNSEFQILLFYFMVFSCIKVGENDPNVCVTAVSGKVL